MVNATSILDGAEILKIDPDDIDVDLSGRIGFYFEDKARAFGRLMAVDGQRDLVKVSRSEPGTEQPWRLHVGLHRTMGARHEGFPIFAIEVSGTPEQLAELETSENLHRRKMEPIEQAKMVAAFATAMQERLAREHGDISQQQIAIRARWDAARGVRQLTEKALHDECADTDDTMSRVYGWQETAAEAFGFDKRTIQRAIRINRLLIEPFDSETVRALADHPVVGKNQKQLLDLTAIVSELKRREVVEILLADRSLSADDARVQAGVASNNGKDAPRRPIEKYRNQITGGWERLSLGEKRRFIPDLATMLHTAELKRAMRDRLNKELGDV